MTLSRDARYVFFSRGRWRVNPPIVHPPFCVCEPCRRYRRDDEWDQERIVRVDRVAPQQSETRAVAYAQEVKRQLESELREATARARTELRVCGGRRSFGELCEAYRRYQQAEGKRFDRDRYRIDAIESYWSEERDPVSITKTDVKAFRESLRAQGRSASTVDRYLNTFLAIVNGALKDGLISHHQLVGMRRMRVKRTARPKTFTAQQVEVLLGPAMERFEREQREERERWKCGSVLPLRGICLIAYRTLMRPANNFGLRWEQLVIRADRLDGSFRLDEHKNAAKGIPVVGPLAPSVVRYLMSIMPARAKGYVHPNPVTGRPFVNIRKSWDRLVDIANLILPESDRIADELHFYNWRHTGASQLAASGADPVMIVRMMGDTGLATVLRHYFNSELSHMQRLVARWDGEADAGEPVSVAS
jgi:integrase